MHSCLSPDSTFASLVALEFAGLEVDDAAGPSHERVNAVLHFASGSARLPDGHVAGALRVSGLCVDGVDPGDLWSLHVFDRSDEVVSLESVTNRLGAKLTAGEMMRAMARMLGDDRMVLDLRGEGMCLAHLRVSLALGVRGLQVHRVGVTAWVGAWPQQDERAGAKFSPAEPDRVA